MNALYSQFGPGLFALHQATQSAVLHEQKTAPDTTLATSNTPAQNNDALQNPIWSSQYARWKKTSFGKTDQWKDANIPAHMKAFREHDKSAQSELGIKGYALAHHANTPEGSASTREQIKLHYEKEYGIDPDKTFLMTFAYNVRGHTPPYPGKVISKISLTDAAIKNMQNTPGHPALPKTSFNQFATNPPPIEIVDNLTIGSQRSSGRHGYQNNPTGMNTQQYEGIYVEPSAGKKPMMPRIKPLSARTHSESTYGIPVSAKHTRPTWIVSGMATETRTPPCRKCLLPLQRTSNLQRAR